MGSDQQLNTALGQLDAIIEKTASNISDFTQNPSDFTRNRKLNASTTLKVTLNMQGNSLNAELLDAFPNLDDRMTASAYEQAKAKLKPEVFKHILQEFNKTMTPQLFNDKYRLFAIDGSDFTTPFNPNSKNVVPTSHNQDMDYETLNRRANSLAHLLRKSGITNNSIVGIMINRSPEMIVGLLAILIVKTVGVNIFICIIFSFSY